jgi:uncharacterized membrane protein YozB (DUF420 family)
VLRIEDLPLLNALLNGLCTVLLIAGYVLIKQRREVAHKRTMLCAFGVSCLFLVSYLIYHYFARITKFTEPQPIRGIYLTILFSHIVLATLVPVLASWTIWLGLTDRRARHRQVARWTLPIWLYVSVTGVVIYVMLYHLFPAADKAATIYTSVITCSLS